MISKNIREKFSEEIRKIFADSEHGETDRKRISKEIQTAKASMKNNTKKLIRNK